jgi:hypothetical protein
MWFAVTALVGAVLGILIRKVQRFKRLSNYLGTNGCGVLDNFYFYSVL